ncbi:unnamed protein product [Clonostachys rhizophaga]|uniref:Uncharacterized protein n=1 Tax=Clonostachys rhizophaga TaxID=160324 RepID=A0A9N9V950_9HYPO|nr:unnamed protein product [Clonostachys rhizophaga]
MSTVAARIERDIKVLARAWGPHGRLSGHLRETGIGEAGAIQKAIYRAATSNSISMDHQGLTEGDAGHRLRSSYGLDGLAQRLEGEAIETPMFEESLAAMTSLNPALGIGKIRGPSRY